MINTLLQEVGLANWGDTWADRVYGTFARRLDLPDKARIPGDTMRKLRTKVKVNEGQADLTGTKDFAGKPHVNTTLDRNVVAHRSGWDGADTYIFPTEDFLAQTFPDALKSIEPSDMFANGVKVTEPTNKITLVSGDINTLKWAREQGMNTLSSPRLRKLYQQELGTGILSKDPKGRSFWREYALEQQRLQAQRGTPLLKDFKLLEERTGMNTGVASLKEKENAINAFKRMEEVNPFAMTEEELENLRYVYPNGRVVDDIARAPQELRNILRMPYNNVFYDPASWVEFNWRNSLNK